MSCSSFIPSAPTSSRRPRNGETQYAPISAARIACAAEPLAGFEARRGHRDLDDRVRRHAGEPQSLLVHGVRLELGRLERDIALDLGEDLFPDGLRIAAFLRQ